MHKYIIFDVDGTLLDCKEGLLSSIKYTIQEHHLKPISDDELKTFIGPPIQNSLINTYKISEKEAQIYANTFRNRYADKDLYKAEVYDGVYELFDFLQKQNYKLGIATYKREDYAINLIKHFHLDKYLDAICGADNNNVLTKKDIISNCMQKLNATQNECIYIGDSKSDAKASKILGIDFIGVTYGYGFKTIDDFKEIFPLFVAHKIKELFIFFNEISAV